MPKNNFKYTVGCVVCLFSALSSSAIQAYQYELNLGYSLSVVDFDANARDDRDISILQLAGSYYFGDIDAADGPVAVAAFLARQSSISVSGSDGELEFANFDLEQRGYSIGGRFHTGDSGWLIGANHAKSTLDRGSLDIEFTSYSVHLGKYIRPNTRITTFFESIETDNSFSTEEDKQFWVELTHLQKLSSGRFYNGEITLGHTSSDDGDDSIDLGLAATYFRTHDLGFSVSYSYSFGEFTDFSRLELGSEWFVRENLSLSVGYRYRKFDNEGASVAGDFGLVDTVLRGVPNGDSHRYELEVELRL